MAVVSRLQLNHPALGTAGGSALHNSIEGLWTEVGDSINGRFFTHVSLADAGSVDFSHNFNVSFDDLGMTLYEYNDSTGELIGQLSTGFAIVEKVGDEKQAVTVSNNSGGAKTIALVMNLGGGAGGAGGSSVDWHAPAGLAPLAQEEFGQPVYLYSNGNDNQLNSSIKIPEGYQLGGQIFLKIAYYTSGTSSSLKLQTVASLIRNGTDAINSVVNQHTSTNAANAGDALAYKYFEVDLDLTDAAGEINGVIVSPGDILNVELTRGSDVETDDIRVIPAATELKF